MASFKCMFYGRHAYRTAAPFQLRENHFYLTRIFWLSLALNWCTILNETALCLWERVGGGGAAISADPTLWYFRLRKSCYDLISIGQLSNWIEWTIGFKVVLFSKTSNVQNCQVFFSLIIISSSWKFLCSPFCFTNLRYKCYLITNENVELSKRAFCMLSGWFNFCWMIQLL